MIDLAGLQNLLGLIVAICIGYCIKKNFFKSAKHSWKSPFIEDSRKPLTPMVTDQAKRNEVLKRAFTPKLANEREWDAIVIGSGIGGMASAALLSKAGMKVLVLEKHDTCGGACHTFRDAGYEFDVGIHFLGNNLMRQTLNRTLMEQISDGQIQFASLDKTYGRVFLDAMTPAQREYDLLSGPNVWKNYLLKQFPDEHKAIETFYSMVKQVIAHMPTWVFAKFLPVWLNQMICFFGLSRFFTFFAFSGRTAKEIHEGLTKNKDLQFLLAHNWPIHGSPPEKNSFVLEAILHGHFEHGACYPVGGGSEIPYRIIPVIERSGGRVLMKANVTQILTEGGKVTGVRVGSKGSSSNVDIHADIVISDAGIHNTLLRLLPESVAKTSPTWPITSSLKPGIGIISMFIGLKGTAEELGLRKENIWAYFDASVQNSFDHIFEGKVLEDMLDKPYAAFNVGFPSAVDPTWESRYPGRSTITVLSFLPYALVAEWSDLTVKKRCDEYNATKNAIGQQIIDQVIHLYPKIKNAVDYFSVGTPISFEHYLNSREGSAYGLEHCLERFTLENSSLLRPESGIEGLFFCGQDILVAGLVTGLLSGFMCAGVALNQKTTILNDLIRLHKKLKTDHTLNEDAFFI